MILITGGTGFVGSHLIKRLRMNGIPIRAVVRNPGRAQALKNLGVDIVPGELSDSDSLDRAASGCERVVHLVGIIQESTGATFESIHVHGTRNVLRSAKKAGVRHFFFQSSLGTRPGAKSIYHKTKWEAEELVRAGSIPFTILRPSLIYGPGDQFTIRLSEMIRRSPVLPIIGSGTSKIQPIYIDDVVSCIEKAMTSDSYMNEMYEIGGPEQLTYEEVTIAIAGALGIKRPKFHVPLYFLKTATRLLEAVYPRLPLTTDQLIMLQEDNVCSLRDIRDAFGVEPVRFEEGLARFLRKTTG